MKEEDILKASHKELYDNVKRASGTEAKVDLFLDFFWKVVMNDLQCLEGNDKRQEERIDKIEKTMVKVLTLFAAALFILQVVVAPIIVKLLGRAFGFPG